VRASARAIFFVIVYRQVSWAFRVYGVIMGIIEPEKHCHTPLGAGDMPLGASGRRRA
jgi:hypothetical protein